MHLLIHSIFAGCGTIFLIGDFENIPGILMAEFEANGLPFDEIPAPYTWNDPLLFLPDIFAPTFSSVSAKTLNEGTKIYRIFDEYSLPEGGFWMYELPTSRAEFFGSSALDQNGMVPQNMLNLLFRPVD